MEANPNFIRQESIALFGPTASGKDWLIRALAKEIERVNRGADNIFYYELMQVLRDGTVTPAIAYPPTGAIAATPYPEDFLYQFTRRARNDRYQCYEHTHNIVIHNDAGSVIVASVLDNDQFMATYQNLLNARNLIILIAPPEGAAQGRPASPQTNIEDGLRELLKTIDSPQEPVYNDFLPASVVRPWSSSDYERFISLLFHALSNSTANIGRRNIAICLTKVDQTRVHRSDSEQVFNTMFPNLVRLIEMQRQTHNIGFFQTSSAGFVNQTDNFGRIEQVPNIRGSNLLDEINWKPFGTTGPFFWIFENLEREHFSRHTGGWRTWFNPRPEYPPYPR